MGTFNYRIFKETEEIDKESVSSGEETIDIPIFEEVFTIRHVGYDDIGRLANYTSEPYWPIGTTSGELLDDITQMILAFNKPILTKEDFE